MQENRPTSHTKSQGVLDVPTPAESAAATERSDIDPDVLRGPRRQSVIVMGLTGTLLITVMAVVLLYIRWFSVGEFNSIIVVWGLDSWNGATVKVLGENLPAEGFSAKLSAKSNMTVRFHVPPGAYEVVAIKDGQVLMRRSHAQLRDRMLWWPFRAPTTQQQQEVEEK